MFHQSRSQAPAQRRAGVEAVIGRVHAVITGFYDCPLPVVAKVRGAVAGFGVSLLAACDLAVASTDSYYTLAYTLIGTSPDGGSTWALPRLVGTKRAKEIALLAERFDAATAERLGLINRAVPEAELDAAVAKLAGRLAMGPAQAFARTKALLNASTTATLAEHLAAEQEAFVACTETADFAEGVAAFVEKRPPAFTGK